MDQDKILDETMNQVVAAFNNIKALNDRANASDPILKANDHETYPLYQCLRAVDSIRTTMPFQVLERGKDGLNEVTGYRFDADLINRALENVGTHTNEGLVVPPGVKDALSTFFQQLESKKFESAKDYDEAIVKVREQIEKKIENIRGKIKGELEERDRLCQRRDAALREIGIFKFKVLRIMEKIQEIPPPEKWEPWGQ